MYPHSWLLRGPSSILSAEIRASGQPSGRPERLPVQARKYQIRDLGCTPGLLPALLSLPQYYIYHVQCDRHAFKVEVLLFSAHTLLGQACTPQETAMDKVEDLGAS